MTLSRIGRFEVQRPLGSGSFATVWLARDEDLDAWVAIKLLAENWSFNRDARRRFIEEARALRRLDSERIVRVYDVGSLDDSRPYMVMEYADRGTLEDRIRLRSQLEQPFSVREALEQSIAIAECMIAVHDLRIVHRDVKPSNVLFRSLPPERQEALRRDAQQVASERTLLGDFGIARRLEGVLGPTMVVGSPQYMAPEQADPARAGLVDYRSDIYSAAVVLYEMLAGRLPLAFLSVTDLRRAVDAGAARPAPVEEVRPDVRPDLARVIERALGRDVEDRPGTAWEWRESLKQCLLGEATPSQAGPPVAVRPRTETGSTLPLASRGSGGRVSTLPAAPRRSTAVLPSASGGQQRTPPVSIPPPPVSVRPQPDTGTSPAVRPRQRVRVAGAVAVAAGLALTAGLLLPWASISGDSGITDRLGTAFRGGNLIVLAAVVLVLAGWRMWQARRRWAAALASSAAFLAGLGAWAVAVYEVVVIRGRVVATLGRNGGATASLGVGLYVVLGGGLAGFLAGYGALRRLRSQARRERTSTLIQGASVARR